MQPAATVRSSDADRYYDRYKCNKDARRFYNSAAWKRLCLLALQRDHYLCQPCLRRGVLTLADGTHHAVARWTKRPGNDDLGSTRELPAQPGRGPALRLVMHNLGRRWLAGKKGEDVLVADTRVVLVCGPPGSGKTTYVRERAQRGDLILDLDALMSALSGQPWYEAPREILPFALAARDAVLERLNHPHGVRKVWVISSLANKADRERLRQRLNAESVMLDVPPEECLRRIAQDERRAHQLSQWEPIVYRWWREYSEEAPPKRRGRPPEARQFYNSAAWQKAREAALVRDHYLCQPCLRRERLTPAVAVHHIKPIETHPELALVLDNLESTCLACHNKEHPEKGRAPRVAVKRRARIMAVQANPEVV